MRLFHISEDPSIARFAPRPPKPRYGEIGEPVVWAVAEDRLWSYMLPRECPRVVFSAGEGTSEEDVERFLAGDRGSRVVAIESGWFERALTTRLTRYELAPERFRLYDAGARYYISPAVELPVAADAVESPLAELVRLGAELRVAPSLWDLRERVLGSTLVWSFIRFANAAPPPHGGRAYTPA